MHLVKLELCLCSHSLWEGCVADDVAEGLSGVGPAMSVYATSSRDTPGGTSSIIQKCTPYGFVLGKDLSLRMVADDARIGIAANVKGF